MPTIECTRNPEAVSAGNLPRYLSPPRLLLMVMLLIFLGEAAVMAIIHYLPPLRWEILTFIDASVLLVVLSPSYYFLYLPLKTHHAERRKAEREVAFLTRHIIRAVEEEKKRLAHDIHDDCGQIMTTLQFGIETLKCSLPKEALDLARQCDRLAALTATLGEHMRNLTARLSPLRLENDGIEAALRWHLEEVGRSWADLQLELQVVGCTDRLPPEIEITLFRISQEALHNIVRHARAGRASIGLRCGDGRVSLCIADDGVGFDPDQAGICNPAPRGFGLLGMRERVNDLNGKLTIRSAPGSGTVIEAELPWKGRKDADPGCHCR